VAENFLEATRGRAGDYLPYGLGTMGAFDRLAGEAITVKVKGKSYRARRPKALRMRPEKGSSEYLHWLNSLCRHPERNHRPAPFQPPLMGKMVDDVRSAVDLLSGNDRIDSRRIYVMGYSLGATVGLLATALDDRIAGAISFCGFTPLRKEKGTGGLDNDAFIHGLLPRLGFFKGNEKRLPWDFDEAMALIAPRPLMVVAPQFDQEATFDDVKRSVEVARQVYEALNPEERSASAYDYNWSAIWRGEVAHNVPVRSLELYAPPDYNHFTNTMQSVAYHWMQLKLLP